MAICNYGYQKVRMSSFIRSVVEAAWSSTECGWTGPADDKGNKKVRDKWSADEHV